MAEIKKAQAAGFAEDSNAFAGGSSVKGTAAPKKAQQKQSGVHQPRDADDTSGQNVQRSGQAETFGQDVQKQTKTSDSRKAKGGQRKQHRKQGAFGQSDKMSENADAGSQKKSDFTKENSTFTEAMAQRRKKGSPAMITATGTPIIRQRKGGITAGGNSVSIRTGNGRKPLILNRISIQKTMPLQREKKRSFRAAKSWISYRRKRRKPEERQKRQDGSCQRKRSIPLSVSLMKRQAGQSMC